MTKVFCAAMFLMLASCGSRASGDAPSQFERVQRGHYCIGMALYEAPDEETFIGRTITEGEIDGVRAINLSMLIDGGERGVWRRESEVLRWYVRVDDVTRRTCQWRPESGPVKPGELEIPLDVPLKRARRGWTTAITPL